MSVNPHFVKKNVETNSGCCYTFNTIFFFAFASLTDLAVSPSQSEHFGSIHKAGSRGRSTVRPSGPEPPLLWRGLWVRPPSEWRQRSELAPGSALSPFGPAAAPSPGLRGHRQTPEGRFRSWVKEPNQWGPNSVPISIFIKQRHWILVGLQPKN